MKKILLFLFIFTSLAAFAAAKAANQSDVLINEIAWMGTANSTNDEWMELLNATDDAISLEGWTLKSDDGKLKINLKGQIPPKGFYLLERTDDNPVAAIPADLIYKGALNNSGQDLKLYDDSGNIIDRANYSSGWLFGDNTTKQTMERADIASWQTSKDPGGTPKAQNSILATDTTPIEENTNTTTQDDTSTTTTESEQGEATATETSPQTAIETTASPTTENQTVAQPESGTQIQPQTTENNTQVAEAIPQKENLVAQPAPISKTYPGGVFINEILPSPEGPDQTDEWIELRNGNNFNVDLEDWKIQDTRGSTTAYAFGKNATIASNGYLLLKRPETKISLNNDRDGLQLLIPNGIIIDSVEYHNAPENQSYNKAELSWKWSPTLTPGSENVVTESTLAKEEGGRTDANIATAAIGESLEDTSLFNELGQKNKYNPRTLFLVALAIIIISAIIVLALKPKIVETLLKKLKNERT